MTKFSVLTRDANLNGADTLDLMTDVKLTKPFHFLWRAGDSAMWCMMDTARRDDGPVSVNEFCIIMTQPNLMQLVQHNTRLVKSYPTVKLGNANKIVHNMRTFATSPPC